MSTEHSLTRYNKTRHKPSYQGWARQPNGHRHQLSRALRGSQTLKQHRSELGPLRVWGNMTMSHKILEPCCGEKRVQPQEVEGWTVVWLRGQEVLGDWRQVLI